MYTNMGNYKQALDYYNKALKINTKLNDRVILAKDHFNMSFPLYSMNKKKQALEHLYTAKTILLDCKMNMNILILYQKMLKIDFQN
ncbi:MAG: tetratricopeptide repeat protein [Candidatus Nitrosocosmicus sp.]